MSIFPRLEMLEEIGLISKGNEEVWHFWRPFADREDTRWSRPHGALTLSSTPSAKMMNIGAKSMIAYEGAKIAENCRRIADLSESLRTSSRPLIEFGLHSVPKTPS
jgi:hypothetical protein